MDNPASDSAATRRLRSVPLPAIALMILSMFMFSMNDVVSKLLAETAPIVQIVFARNLLSLAPMAWILWRAEGAAGFRTQRPWAHVARSVFALLAWGVFIFAISNMPLADAVTIGFASPLIMTILAIPLLGEKVPRERWIVIAVGFAGVLIVTNPVGSDFGWPVIAALFSATSFALAMNIARLMSTTETSLRIVFYFTLFGTVAAGLLMPFFAAPIPAGQIWLYLLIGVLGTGGQIVMVQAFRLGEVSLIAPFSYTALVWAMGSGWLIWGDVPSPTMLLGAAIIIASGVYTASREWRRR